VHLLQIWIMPDTNNLKPAYEQNLLPADQQNSLLILPVSIHQDAKIYRGRLSKGHELTHEMKNGRGAWIQMVSGTLSVNAHTIETGDAALVEKEKDLKFITKSECEFLLFDLK